MSDKIVQFVPKPNPLRERLQAEFDHLVYKTGLTDRSVFDPEAFAAAFGDELYQDPPLNEYLKSAGYPKCDDTPKQRSE